MPVLADPPDPHPKTPRLRCPPGAVDCHVHLFGPKAEFPFMEGARYVSEDRLPATQIAMQDVLGISRAVIVSGGAYGPNTRHLEHVLERHGDRFLGVALSPNDATVGHLRRLDRLGVRAVRFVSKGHGPKFLPISTDTVARIADLGWHVQYYPYRTELAEMWKSLLDLPTDIVIDHFGHVPAAGGTGQPAFQALLRLLDSGRVWVKLSGPMRLTDEEPLYPSVTPLARALVAHRPDRLLWASDWPHVNMNGRTMPNDGDLLDLLVEWAPDEAARAAILAENPARLFRLSAVA
jgi:predicted TIM-barrel fold metal-dependent hydrolase